MTDAPELLDEIVGWLAEIGYPYDFCTDPPIPERFRRPLAEYVHAREEPPGSRITVDDYYRTMVEEGRWLL